MSMVSTASQLFPEKMLLKREAEKREANKWSAADTLMDIAPEDRVVDVLDQG